MISNRLVWYGHVISRDDIILKLVYVVLLKCKTYCYNLCIYLKKSRIKERVMSMNVDVECGVTRMDRIRNEYIWGSLKVAPVFEKMRSNRLT
jgi:hypothetical protein